MLLETAFLCFPILLLYPHSNTFVYHPAHDQGPTCSDGLLTGLQSLPTATLLYTTVALITCYVESFPHSLLQNALLLKAIYSLVLNYLLYYVLSTPSEALTLPAPTTAHAVLSFGIFFTFLHINTL